jgi:single-stranded DNA-binding protein
MIEGSLEVRTYTNDESQKITSVSVLADRVNFLGGKFAAAVSPDLDSIASQ